ncbi:MAG: HlyD family secretion protein [Polyangiales bacterium]
MSATTADVPAPAAAPAVAKKRPVAILAVLALVVSAAGGWWFTHRGIEATDDAQLDADVVAVPARASGTVTAIHFVDNQRVEKDALLVELDSAPAKAKLAQAEAELVAAQASSDAAAATATLTETNAKAGKEAAKAGLTGAALAVTATADLIAEAKANLVAAKSARDKAKQDLDRAKALAATGSIPGSQLESAQTAFDSAEAAVTQAEARVTTIQANTSQAQAKVGEASAKLAQADSVEAQIAESKARAAATKARVATAAAARDLALLELSYTQIKAPRAGIVSKRSVAVGQLAAAGMTVVMIVPGAEEKGAVWVTANFKETQVAHMHIGQPATMTVDAYGGRELHGTIESFSGATGARFALLPPDNATGNYTKVVQRVPVRIKLENPPKELLLLPGMSVELSVDTRK